MSTYGSQQMLNSGRRASSKGQLQDLGGGGTYHYARSDAGHGGGYGYEFGEGYKTKSLSRSMTTKGGMMKMSSGMGSSSNGGSSPTVSIANRATQQQILCNEYLKKAEFAIQAGSGDAEHYMELAREAIEKLKYFALELRQMGQPFDGLMRNVDLYTDQLKEVHMVMSGTMQRRKSMSMSRRKSSGGWEESARSYNDAMAWIAQQKRLIETTAWADDPGGLEQQLINHQRFHSSIQRSPEVQRAIDEMKKLGDKPNQYALEQEWDSLKKMSNLQTEQLRETILFIEEISREIMWVNEKEEEELMFDWSDRNIEKYIPTKQESYSQLMSALETKEKDLHKLQTKAKTLLKKAHPASDKIEAYMDTLQTQWSWLLQITMCIDTHLKENAAYCQFFREANDTHKALQNQHEIIRKTFSCNKDTSMEDLKELLKGLEREKENITDLKRQVQHLTAKSKTIVRLKPRNPQEKSSSGIIVKALTDFKQDQKVIRKDNEAILKDNSQRSKWSVTGPGGIDMLIPSVCLIVPPPNPLSISLANKNEQYYEAIMSLWNQLYINVKSLIAWHYCLMDINYVNSLTVSMLSKMRPEEYRQIMKKLETHFEEFKIMSHGSEMFADEDKRSIENQVAGAQNHYDKLVVELPTYSGHQEQIEVQQITEHQVQPQVYFIQQQPQQHQVLLLQQEQQQHQLTLLQQQQLQHQQIQQQQLQQQQIQKQQQREQEQQQQAAAEEEARRLEEERRQAELKKQVKKEMAEKEHTIKREVVKVTKTEQKRKTSSSSSASAFSSSSHLLAELHALRLRMDAAEGSLSQYVHVCFGDDGAQDCGLRIIQLESVQDDVDSMRDAYMRLRERILQELENMNDQDKAQFLRSEIGVINQRLGSLESSSSAYVLRLRAIRDMLESIERVEDIVKVHEARLTEKETTSLSPAEVIEYMEFLKKMKAELGQRRDLLASMESELSKASHWNSQMSGSFHRCDLMLSNFTEKVGLLSDRWRRIQAQIDTRLQDLQMYLPQLEHYKETNTSITEWIDATRRKQDALQATKIESIEALHDHINNQKALNTEIKAKRETVDSVLRDNVTCVNTIKDYETDLNSYTSGLETLLNIPIKRTMLKSPSMDLNQEAIHLQTRYMELLTISGDYYKFLGQLLKNMEELKIRNTHINLLEDDLRRLREDMQERNAENKSLEEAVAQFKLQLSLSQEQLLSLEEVKQTTALQCSATKDSLDSTQSQLADLNSEVDRLKYLLAEEKRKTKLAEERYTQQQEEYQSVLGKRQKELESVNWSKIEVDKSLKHMEHENEQLRRQLTEESTKLMELQKEISKVRSHYSTEINNLKLSYESQIHISRTDIQRLSAQRDEDTAELQIQYERMEAERRSLEDELRRLRTINSQTEEQKKRVEEEACSQRAMLIEDAHKRREMESQMEQLMRQREEERNQYREELDEVLKTLQEKDDQLVYATHSLEEETRRRKIAEEGQVVLEQSLANLQVNLSSSSMAATQLRDCEEELLQERLQLERERKERSRVEQNMNRLQGRIKDLQGVRDSLEGQVENLRRAHQEEVGMRMKAEAELEKSIVTLRGYTSTIATLRQSQEQASTSERRGEEERIRLKDELEKVLRQSQSWSDQNTQLSAELKTIKQQLLLEQNQVKEGNLRNEGLYKTIEEKSKALNEITAEAQRLKEVIETQTKERLRMEEELRAVQQAKEELLKTKNIAEERQVVLEQSLANLEVNLSSSSMAATQLRDCEEELLQARLQLESESKERSRVEQNMNRLQGRIKDLQGVRDSLEGQIENLRRAHQEEVGMRMKAEAELEKSTVTLRDYTSTIATLRQSQEQASTSEKRGEEERIWLKDELEKVLRQSQSWSDQSTQLSAELKTIKQQLLLEQNQVKEGNLRNEGLYKTIEEKSKALNEITAEAQRLKEVIETQTKERLRMEEELRAVRQAKEELLKSQKVIDDELSSQITALELQLQASERNNVEHRSLVSELSSESKKLKLEAEKMQEQVTEKKVTIQSLQSQYNEIVSERDILLQKLQRLELDREQMQRQEEELNRIKLSLEAEFRTKQRLQEENERVKRDLNYWKDQCDGKQSLIRQFDTDKDILEREKKSLKSEIERLMKELRELEVTYKSKLSLLQKQLQDTTAVRQTMETELKRTREPPTLNASSVVFDGVRKPVTAKQLLDCRVLDKPTYNQLLTGHKTVPEVSAEKKVPLKGTGPIAGVIIESPKSPGSSNKPLCKLTFTEAKKENILPPDSIELLLDAQAATGHIIDPRTNQKLTVEEAYNQGVVDEEDRERLLAAEAAAVGYSGPGTNKPLSVFQAMKKGIIDKTTALRLLQAQESVGGILDPVLSVFLPRDTATERDLVDDNTCSALNQRPDLYLDPETEKGVTYMAMKRKCKIEPHTGLLLLPVPEKVDPSNLVFDGVRKPVTAKHLLDCRVLDKPTFKDLEYRKRTVPEVSEDIIVNLKGTGPIAGVIVNGRRKMSLTEAKKQMLLTDECADLLLEAQAATGHIIDPKANKKLTVEEACAKGIVDINDLDRLLASEAAATGYRDPSVSKPISVFEAMKKGLVEDKNGLRLLQAQESVGGILDPGLSVFLPRDTAIKRRLIDKNMCQTLDQIPEDYIDPETEEPISYQALKKSCKIEAHTGLLLLPVTEKLDPSKLIFDGVRKPVSAKHLFDCGVIDKPTLSKLVKGDKTVAEVSVDKNIFLKGTGSIAGITTGSLGKFTFSEAKKQMLIPSESADLLLEAQAATGHIIDPISNQKLTVEEACARGLVDRQDQDKLLAAEAAAIGYKDPHTGKPLSVFEALKKGLIDKKTGLRFLQAQECAGGVLDQNLSVFLPKDTAMKRNLLDEDLCRALKQNPDCYLDPDTERDASYGALKKKCKTDPHTGLMLLPLAERKDPSKLIFDGVRKPVSAKQLLECSVLDKPTFNKLLKGEKTVPEVSADKKVFLKGTGSIAGVTVGSLGKMTISEAKKQMHMPSEISDLLLEAQAATGHIIDPISNQKLTVEEACARGLVDRQDQDKLLAAEAAAVGYKDPHTGKPLSVFEALKRAIIDKKTGLRFLQAQECAGGVLDPNLSVFLPKDTAMKRNLLDEDLGRALNQNPDCYLDPDTERDVSYGALMKKCKTEPHTGLMLLPLAERKDPSKLIFDGVRKPVSAKQLLECSVLDKPTFNKLLKGEKTVPEASADKKVFLKGTGSIAGVTVGSLGKMTISEAKKQMHMPSEIADLLLEAQAATGHIIDPISNQKLTVEEACARGLVDRQDRDKLLAAEAAAVGYNDPHTGIPLSVFEALKKGLIDKKTGLRFLQAQECAGGVLDPNLSVFLPKDTAMKRNLLDEDLGRALNQNPDCYLDPDTERDASYGALKKKCKTDPHTGLMLLPLAERKDPSKLIFDGVRKPVSAKQLLECSVLDKPTFNKLLKGEKTVPEVSADKKVFLKGTGSIAGVTVGSLGKMTMSEAKKQMHMPSEISDMLLEAQAATGHIIDPISNQKLTVEEACARGLVDRQDQDKLLAAEAAAVGYKDPHTGKPLSVFEALKRAIIDKKTGLRFLQAQECAGGVLDPNLSVFLPKDTAMKRNLLDEDLGRALNQNPDCYLDPDTERDVSYGALKKKCKTEPHTGLMLLPLAERKDPSKLIFDGVRKPVSAKQLLECSVLDKPTFNKLLKGEKTVPEASADKKVFLKGTGSIAGVTVGSLGKMTISEAKKQMHMPSEIADLLLEAQAATGHIIDPISNQKLTVEEACARGLVDRQDRDKLLAAEAAAVGYNDPHTGIPLSVFEALKKGLIDKKTGLRFLQAQECAGGVLDPNLSVFLPKDTAMKRNLLDEDLGRALNQNPDCYLDPDTERDVSYGALMKKCKTEPHTGLMLLPLAERKDPSKLIFDGVRKPVSAKQLLECSVLDKPTFNKLLKGEKTVPEASADKKVFLKGTGSIAGVTVGSLGKMTISEAKKQMHMPSEIADLLLEAQAATGHIIDPISNQKLTVEEACARGLVDRQDRDKLLAAEAAAVGYNDPHTGIPLSVFEALKKGLIDKKTGLRFLQAQECAGGVLDPNLSVFLPKETAMKRNLLDEDLCRALKQNPDCYLDPDTERDASYGALKKKCKTDPHTGLMLLPLAERKDPSKLIFDGVRKPVSAKQLLECSVLDKPTFNKLLKGDETVQEVSADKKVFLKGTGSIAGVTVGSLGKMTISEAKKQMHMPSEIADLLLEAQAATGHIIDPISNQKLTVEEACARGLVDRQDRDKLLAAEAAAVGYKDPHTGKPLSVFEALKRAIIDKKTGLRFLQAQECAGGVLDPNLSVFLPKDTAMKRNLLDEDLGRALNQNPDCYLDPDTERDVSYGALTKKCKTEPHTGLMLLPLAERKDPSKLIFDGVRKPVSAKQLLECSVLDKPTFNKLLKGEKTVPEASADKKVFLKGTGSIAGVTVGSLGKMTISEAKKQMHMPSEIADLLLEAQAATGHIIDPISNQKLTVEEACARGLVDRQDRDKLLAAEAAAVGYKDPRTRQPLSVFDALKKGLIDKKTAVRLLQAQDSAGGVLDPNLSVFLPKDTAMKRNLLDEDLCRALNQNPDCYLDPDTERDASYGALKKKCKTDPHTGLMLLPVAERKDPSKLIFDGVRKPVSAQQLLECGVLDKPTFNKLLKGEKTVPEVSEDKKGFLKGTESIAGVTVGSLGKMTVSEAKKQMLMPSESADLLLEAQAATGHIIDPISNQKLTVEEACARGLVDRQDRDKLLAAEAAAVGYKDPRTRQPLSVFDALKKGLIDKKTAVRLLQAQESAGGILDPNLSVFLPKDTAMKRNLLDEDLCRALNQNPDCYLDPDTERYASYGALKKKCKTDPHTGLMLLPVAERKDPSKLIFDGVCKPVSAQQLLECGVLDKPTFNKLLKGEKTVPEVSADKKGFLKGTGSIAGVTVGSLGKMTVSEAKKQMLMPSESADMLLEAQAATGHIIDPISNQKLTVEEACARGLVDRQDRDKLLAAEAAAVGYKDPRTRQPLSVFDALKKGLIDKKTAVRLLQAQESAGGILDPNLSVFLPKDTAMKRNLLDEDLCRALNQNPDCYLDPDTERDASYGALKKKCKTDPHTGLMLLPVAERKDPSKLIFDGVCKPVSAQQLLECGVLDKPTFNKLLKGEKTVPEVSADKKGFLKGTGSIAGVTVGSLGKMTISEAKKQILILSESADLLLEAQAATGHIIDPISNQKLTVEEACARGLVDRQDRDKLLAAEAAAVGYKDPRTRQPLSVFDALKKGLIDKKTAVRFLQAQESAGGILDPNLSVFLPKDTAMKRNLLDEDLCRALNQNPDCYLDPDTERDASYGALKKKCKTDPHTGLMLLPVAERKDPSKLIFDGVCKPVSAQQLLEWGVLDKPTFNKLLKGEKTVPEVSADKKGFLKGTGSIAGVTVGSLGKMTISEAKKQMLILSESADLLLEAQAATGHIIDPISNQKLTVEEACARGLVDRQDRDKLLAAEAAAVGYKDPRTRQPLSVFDALKKGLIDKKTAVRLLQAQESAGGILDPNLSVFLPKDTAMKRNLLDEDLCRALNQNPDCYLDPDTERDASYGALKKKCQTDPHNGLMLLPLGERKDPSKLIFDGVRKPVYAQQLLECGVLDQSTFKKLIKGEKTVTEVSQDKKVNLKGTGPIAGVFSSLRGNISLTEAKKQKIISEDSADLLLEAQAATGHIVDPKTGQKLTVEVACSKGVVDFKDQARLLAAEYAAVGYKDQYSGRLIPVFEAMKKGVIDETTGLRLLQAQDSVGGILDPTLSVFLPKDTAIKRNLLDDKVIRALNQNPACYLDPESEKNISYGALKAKCNTNTHTGLHILPVSEKFDPSNLLFDGIQKTVTAQQLLDCGVLDKKTFGQLIQGKKTVSDVSVDIKIFLKGTGSIAGVAAGPLGKMSFTEAKKEKIMSSESANMLLLAQAATGHIIDPRSNKTLTVKEACAKGLVDKEDEPMLFAAEAAAIGYRDPGTATFLSAGQAMRKGIIDKKTALRILQAQESVGGILDPSLGVFLPKDIARKRNLIDDDLHQTLNQSPECYLDPNTQQPITYVSLKKKCKSDPSTGLLLLPKPEQQITIRGLRNEVSVIDLVDANLLNKSDVDQLNAGKLTSQDIEDRLRSYLGGSNCIAGVYDEANDKVLSIYQAMKNDILRRGTTLELLEAQAASGFMIDPVKNLFLTVAEASKTGLFGPEFKDKLLSAEKAVTGYKIPGTEQIVSLFQAIENGLVERGHGIRLLEAQIASGGIIDPQHSHRIDVDVAYKRGYFNEEMNKILTDESDDTKGFFDPNTQENLTYLELKKRCILDKNTGLVLLPIIDKKKKKNQSSQKNTVRKRRVIIVDPETDKEMTVREAYNKGYIDYDTYLELSEHECEWEEIAITAADGSIRFVITDKSTGRQFDINDLLEKKVIDQSVVEQYRSNAITIAQFADIISNKTKHETSSVTSSLSSSSSSNLTQEQPGRSSVTSSLQMSTSGTSASFSSSLGATSFPSSSSSFTSTQVSRPLSPTFTKTTTTKITTIEKSSSSTTVFEEMPDSLKQVSSVSVTLLPPLEAVGGVEPVGAIFDTETLEKVSITEAFNRGLLDSITAQRLLEAQVCTGGIVNPSNGKRVSLQEASRMGIITNDMAIKLKPAQKAFFGYEDMKMNRKLSAAQAMKEMWLPYEAGQRFLEFQVATGGLYDPEKGCRRSIEDARKMGWLDVRGAQKLQDIQQHTKNLTCPKSKLKISYKEVLDNCLVEEGTRVKMLQASSVSSRGISSPYNIASAPGSKTGSRSGSQRGSRRNSLDLGRSSTQYLTSFTSFSSTR